jgi:hypothetical protein
MQVRRIQIGKIFIQHKINNMMNTLEKMLGAKGCYLIVGDSEKEMPVGYAAYGAVVGIDDTEISTLDHLIAGTPTELADATWESVALKQGDFIPFEYPVVAITLTNATDRLFCYLEETDYVKQGG